MAKKKKKQTNEQNNEHKIQPAENQKANDQNSKTQKENTKRSNEDKIERLKAVKKVLEAEKEHAQNRADVFKISVEGEGGFPEWQGNKKTTLMGNVTSTIVPEYSRYVGRIDEILDEVCNEITRLQNENMSLSWDIFNLGSAINSLINEIRTYYN